MFLVFDIGGTKTRLAVSDDKQTLRAEPLIIPTPLEWGDAKEKIENAIAQLGDRYEGVCGGLPGMLDEGKETLLWSPNLPDWVGKPIQHFFADVTGAPVSLCHDTALAGIAEARRGAGEGHRIVAYITVSTGVGGTRLVDGKPDVARYQAEPGDQIIDPQSGLTLEGLVSGSAFAEKYGPDFVTTTPSAAWQEAGRILALGLHNTIIHWSPDIMVLGGSMITKPIGISLEVVSEHLSRLMKAFPDIPVLAKSKFADRAGLVGALLSL